MIGWFVGAVAVAAPMIPGWGVPADSTVRLSEEVVRTERWDDRYLTRRTAVSQNLKVSAGGRYRQDPLAWVALVVELRVSEDRNGVMHQWDLWSGRTPDPELWRWVQRPESAEVQVDRLGVPAISARGEGVALDAAVKSRLEAEVRGWMGLLPETKMKPTQPITVTRPAPPWLDAAVDLSYTWTLQGLGEDGSAVLEWQATLAAPAAAADPVQTVSGKGALSWDPRTGVVLRDEGKWSLRVQDGGSTRSVSVERVATGRVDPAGGR